MIPSNSYYGHAHILRAYARVRAGRVKGYVQHGWELGSGLPRLGRTVRAVEYFVWSDRNLRRTPPELRAKTTLIGAPFLYLNLPPVKPPKLRDTICYPFHASEWDPVDGSHGDLADELCSRYGSSNTTICLYWLEYEDQKIRKFYEDAGFRVICHGFREDPFFLLRLQTEMLSHSTVVSNRVSTALFYGGILGRRVELAGEMWKIRGRSSELMIDHVLSKEFPDLFAGGLSPDEARELAAIELGLSHKRESSELKEILGWANRSQTTENLHTTRVRGAHYARSLLAGIRER